MVKTRVGIINVTGYAGSELARILYRHTDVEVVQVTGRSAAGKMLSEVFPYLRDADIKVSPALDASVDFVFSALPHAASAEALIPFIEQSVPCIDLSADFRLKDRATYEQWYKIQHPIPEYLSETVYGLPELHRAKIKRARLVANPGCYPTGTILGLAPAVDAGIVDPDVISDCKSGVSGAGRSNDAKYGFSELNDNISAYALSGHRHAPEMIQELSSRCESGDISVTFVPHLAPMTRGILGTHYANLASNDTNQRDVVDLYRSFYGDEPFVRVIDSPPSTKETWGSNYILINVNVDEANGRLIVITALDNLMKGAAGAAVQNMNLMLGMPEDEALDSLSVYP